MIKPEELAPCWSLMLFHDYTLMGTIYFLVEKEAEDTKEHLNELFNSPSFRVAMFAHTGAIKEQSNAS